MTTTRIATKFKYPDQLGMRWTEEVLGEDESGEWAVIPTGSPVHLSRGRVIEFGSDQLFCYPRDRWWVAHFWGPNLSILVRQSDGSVQRQVKEHPCYVDMSTPAVRTDGGISFTDLILDVVADEAGEVTALDEDELSTANLPGEYLRRAEHACTEVVSAMRETSPPFDDSADRWRRQIERSTFNEPIGFAHTTGRSLVEHDSSVARIHATHKLPPAEDDSTEGSYESD